MSRLRQFAALLTLGICCSVSSHPALACWDMAELSRVEGLSEIDGEIILSFKDAVDCSPIGEAQVTLGKDVHLETDAQGYVHLPQEVFEQLGDSAYVPMVVEKPGYIPLKTELVVKIGTVLNRRQVMSRGLAAGTMRFVLSWQHDPADLDLHLISDDFHISYRDKHSVEGRASLDRDAQHGYGPETITLNRMEPGKRYRLAVHNFSGSFALDGARVEIYADNKLAKVITLPNTAQPAIDVLTMSDGGIRVVNKPAGNDVLR